MPDATNTATTAAKKAATVITDAAPAIADNLPDVTEIAVNISTGRIKALIFAGGVAAGGILAGAGYWGYQKFQARRAAKVEVPNDISSLDEKTEKK